MSPLARFVGTLGILAAWGGEFYSAAAELYDEALRPQFHFTARENWHNDPNGLVFYGGEYHLFFQHNPSGREWGNMTWGHAVSPDLVHWKQLDHAIYPDRLGTIFSGSAIVDRQNAGGFQQGKDPALVAFYTAAGGTSPESKDWPFTQCLAYSNDRGRTWVKYEGNPVLPNVGEGDRDPKVFWHAPSHHWVMPLYVGERQPDRLGKDGKPTVRNTCHFYTSTDLKHWSFASKFDQELYECPGLVELPVDGKSTNTRFVLWGASGDYWVGTFDGTKFTAEAPRQKGDFGSNYYAAQAYDDLPDHRVVLVSWMSGGRYPGMPFNQQMGFPSTLRLQSSPGGIHLVKWPVAELSSLVTRSTLDQNGGKLVAGTYPLEFATAQTLDLELAFKPGAAKTVSLSLRGIQFTWDASSQTLSAFDRKIPLPTAPSSTGEPLLESARGGLPGSGDSIVRFRILLDRSSVEIYGNGGLACASFCFVPSSDAYRNVLSIDGGTASFVRLLGRNLKSAWRP
jgi:sucrose-6-phosphate hydrolase SacC (GH32 family)